MFDEEGSDDEDDEENIPEEPSPQPRFLHKIKKLSARDGKTFFRHLFFAIFFLKLQIK